MYRYTFNIILNCGNWEKRTITIPCFLAYVWLQKQGSTLSLYNVKKIKFPKNFFPIPSRNAPSLAIFSVCLCICMWEKYFIGIEYNKEGWMNEWRIERGKEIELNNISRIFFLFERISLNLYCEIKRKIKFGMKKGRRTNRLEDIVEKKVLRKIENNTRAV